MSDFWSKLFFWLAFSAICFIVLRYFYYTKNATLLLRLRVIAGLLQIAALVLLFFPWTPGAHGYSGWSMVLQGDDAGMTILAGLMLFTAISLVFKKPFLYKAGAVCHVAATILLFGLMIKMFPDTIQLTLADSAPIFVALIMLINNVVLLLLWNQLQINKKA